MRGDLFGSLDEWMAGVFLGLVLDVSFDPRRRTLWAGKGLCKYTGNVVNRWLGVGVFFATLKATRHGLDASRSVKVLRKNKRRQGSQVVGNLRRWRNNPNHYFQQWSLLSRQGLHESKQFRKSENKSTFCEHAAFN